MDKERLFRFLNQKYFSKCEMISKLPLGMNPDKLWEEVIAHRLEKAVQIPLCNVDGKPYWYILTSNMISASENIVDELMEHTEESFPASVLSLEEAFFTGYMEGAQISIQDAVTFLQSGEEPHDIEELMILNNRNAGTFAAENLKHPIDDNFLHNLAYILTNGLDNGGGNYRTSDSIEIPSMNNESFILPKAENIPSLVNDFSSYLSDAKVHPLIKSAVAQAWILVSRPFPEGNERLARLLSCIILVRAGYSFFSNVSLSSIIARNSYDYFQAVANIIRTENSGDLTYFLDYYIRILSSAVDELRKRRKIKNEDLYKAEHELAQVPLSPPSENKSAYETECAVTNNTEVYNNSTPAIEEIIARIKNRYKSSSQKHGLPDFLIESIKAGALYVTNEMIVQKLNMKSKTVQYHTNLLAKEGILIPVLCHGKKHFYFPFATNIDGVILDKSPVMNSYECTVSNPGIIRVHDFLSSKIKQNKGKHQSIIFNLLIQYLNTGHHSFSSKDILESTNLPMKSINNNLKLLADNHILKATNHPKFRRYIYEFAIDEIQTDIENTIISENEDELISEAPEYSDDILNLISELKLSNDSSIDRRLGGILHSCLQKGFVSQTDYDLFENTRNRFSSDMQFAKELGLIYRESPNKFVIRKELDKSDSRLEDSIKNTISTMYDIFGDSEFSQDMVVAKLDYSSGHISACLHKFTWLKILDCKKDNNKKSYQFIINPTDNPECFISVA